MDKIAGVHAAIVKADCHVIVWMVAVDLDVPLDIKGQLVTKVNTCFWFPLKLAIYSIFPCQWYTLYRPVAYRTAKKLYA